MTEEERWLTCESLADWPVAPTSELRDRHGDRRIFLFLAAYLPWFLSDQFCPTCQRHLPFFENHAEEALSLDEWRAAVRAEHTPVFAGVPCQTRQVFVSVIGYLRGLFGPAKFWSGFVRVYEDVEHQLRQQHQSDPDGTWHESHRFEAQETWRDGMYLLKEIAGNPFRPVAFDPAWRTTDVMLLATGIYAERAFDRMPILADALQDAGCDADALLSHLRDPHATHVRGCWALDLVLGKE